MLWKVVVSCGRSLACTRQSDVLSFRTAYLVTSSNRTCAPPLTYQDSPMQFPIGSQEQLSFMVMLISIQLQYTVVKLRNFLSAHVIANGLGLK